MGVYVPDQLREFNSALLANGDLVEVILRKLPSGPKRERVTIKTDCVSVDRAIARSFALGVAGVEAEIELTEEGKCRIQ